MKKKRPAKNVGDLEPENMVEAELAEAVELLDQQDPREPRAIDPSLVPHVGRDASPTPPSTPPQDEDEVDFTD